MAIDVIPPRYESKFAVPPRLVPHVRAAIEPYCVPDEHAGPDGTYPIISLYYDTPELLFFKATVSGARERFKLRVRGYDDPRAPVALEVKHKIGDVVVKRRAFVPAAGWAKRLAEPPGDDATPEEHDFRARLERFAARPVLVVRYEREAWKSEIDAYARATFDFAMRYQSADDASLVTHASAWLPVDDGEVLGEDGRSHALLELKHGRDVPRWMVDVVRRYELERIGFSKYATACARLFSHVERVDPMSRHPRYG